LTDKPGGGAFCRRSTRVYHDDRGEKQGFREG